MYVKVRHFLAAIPANVGDCPIAIAIDAQLTRDLSNFLKKPSDSFHRSITRKIAERNIFSLGNYQHMHRRLRADIVEGQYFFIFIDLSLIHI